MNTNLDYRQKVKFNYPINQNIPKSSLKTSTHAPIKLSIGGNMIGRVHYSNPGCGSCGK